MIVVDKAKNIYNKIHRNDDAVIIMDKENFNLFNKLLDHLYEHYPALEIRDGKIGNMLDILQGRCEDIRYDKSWYYRSIILKLKIFTDIRCFIIDFPIVLIYNLTIEAVNNKNKD